MEKMVIHHTDFIGSFPDYRKCPEGGLPEYVFIGRSNVGKSSLINRIMGRKNLAHVSSKPGKTQSINYYMINDSWYLVDLPGYGYAKSSKSERKAWRRMILNYLEKRETLMCTFLLIDGNIPYQKSDREFMAWMGEKGLPFVIVYTKNDKSKSREYSENVKKVEEEMLEEWESLPDRFITSALNNEGIEDIRHFIEKVNGANN